MSKISVCCQVSPMVQQQFEKALANEGLTADVWIKNKVISYLNEKEKRKNKKKWILDFVDSRGEVLPYYRQILTGTRDEVMNSYLYWIRCQEWDESINESSVRMVEA